MRLKLLVDIGSTFTKVVAVDFDTLDIVSRAQAPSTVQEDVTIGLEKAIAEVGQQVDVSSLQPSDVLVCSSAAGGLRVVSIGFVPELSSTAATRAALGAGAKIVGHYSNELTMRELSEIDDLVPDIILLAGGTNGGDKRVIVHNGKTLAHSKNVKSWIVVAGNKAAEDDLREIFRTTDKNVRFTDNIMPDIGMLDVDSCQKEIARIFLENIVEAKGIAKAKAMSGGVLMPTPVAVLKAARLLSEGMNGDGLGEIVVVDVGGATTDVHSIGNGFPSPGVTVAGMLPELYVKRTVEGDLGVRHNMDMLAKFGENRGVLKRNEFREEIEKFSSLGRLPENEMERFCDLRLAFIAVDVAMERHAGKLEVIYSTAGKMLVQHGKNLSNVKCVIGTGGPIVFSSDPTQVLQGALSSTEQPNELKPVNPSLYVDERYILYAAGLLAEADAGKALQLMKKYLKTVETRPGVGYESRLKHTD
jgi:uncharacterized protein (TIGR01319 family)